MANDIERSEARQNWVPPSVNEIPMRETGSGGTSPGGPPPS